jgi:hypothetical protein
MILVFHCAECGFTYGVLPRRELAADLVRCAAQVGERLDRDAVVCSRRDHSRWSPLEYACHLRDVLLVQRDRVYVALVEAEPSFKPMYRDQRVEFDRYDQQDPAYVAAELVMAARLFANALSGLSDEQWNRSLVYGFPEPSVRDLEWVAHHTLHEAVHHLMDIDGILEAE